MILSTPGVFWTFHCYFFCRKPALSKCEPEHLYLFAPDLLAVGHASYPTYNSIVFSNEDGERDLSSRSVRPVEGFRVGKIRWQQSIANCAAEPDRVWLKPRTAFAYLIIQIRNGPGLEGDQFLQGSSVCRHDLYSCSRDEGAISPMPLLSCWAAFGSLSRLLGGQTYQLCCLPWCRIPYRINCRRFRRTALDHLL